MALTNSQVHLDQILTDMTVAYLQDEKNFIANQIFPSVSVSKQSDRYYVWDRGQFNRTTDVKLLAPGTESEEITLRVSTDTYFCDIFAQGISFTEQELANEDVALDIRAAGAATLARNMMLKREQDFLSTYFAPGVWATQYGGVAAAPTASQVIFWSDYATSRPIRDVTTAKTAAFLASGGFEPNVMLVTRDVRDILINHPDILARLNGGATVTNTALVTNAKLAEIFDVEKFLVVNAVVNTAREGLAEVNALVGTRGAALYYVPKKGGLLTPASGYNFTWNAGTGATYDIAIRSYTGNDALALRHVTEKVEAVMSYDMKIVSTQMGVFFNQVIQ
jgi:hypothetical protein